MDRHIAPNPPTSRREAVPPRWDARLLLAAVIALLALLTTSPPVFAESGWQAEERLTFDEAISYGPPNNAKYIAVDLEGRVHVVWADERDRNLEIYHMVKSNCVWSGAERLTASAERSTRPTLAVDALGRVNLVWNDSRDGNKEIYHRIWAGSWDEERRVSETDGDSFAASVVADGFSIHLVYNEIVNGHNEVMYRIFNLFDWSEATQLTSVSSGDRTVSSIAIGPDGSLHVAWWDTREDPPGNTEGKIYYRRRIVDWLPEECVSGPEADAMRPNITVDDSGYVHIVWIDKREPYEQIYYRKHANGGWGPETPVTTGSYTHYHPSIAYAAGEVYLAYWVTYPSILNPGVYFRTMTAGSWSGESRITADNSVASICCLIAEPDKNLHVAWVDQRDGNMEIYYRLYIHPQNGTGDVWEPEPPETPAVPIDLEVAPNPFSTAARIALSLPEETETSIRIYDVAGRCVRVLAEGRLMSGRHPFLWEGTDERGKRLSPGLYFIRANVGKSRVTRKVILVR
jgi:hypothetical protein